VAQFGAYKHPEVSMNTPSLSEYVTLIEKDEWRSVGELMLRSAAKLVGMGADLLICPDNTIHQALPFVMGRSPKPWLHIAEVVADEALRRGFRKVGLVGTRSLVKSDVYESALERRGLECVRPSVLEIEQIDRIIMEELVAGVFRSESIQYFQQVFHGMKADGCCAVVLGCTEIPIIINDNNSPIPTLDSTRLLARAALACASVI